MSLFYLRTVSAILGQGLVAQVVRPLRAASRRALTVGRPPLLSALPEADALVQRGVRLPRARYSYVTRGISLQRHLERSLREYMVIDGYNEKQRTRWIEEALAGLMLYDPAMLKSGSCAC